MGGGGRAAAQNFHPILLRLILSWEPTRAESILRLEPIPSQQGHPFHQVERRRLPRDESLRLRKIGLHQVLLNETTTRHHPRVFNPINPMTTDEI